MGIKVMGDLISILKHARKVYNQVWATSLLVQHRVTLLE